MANGRSNYGGYGGYNNLISGMRNNTLPNIGGHFMLGLQHGQEMHSLRLAEKKLELQEQEKLVLDALNNEAWAPDTSELSPWAQDMMAENLGDMKNQYFEATKQGLGSKVNVGDKAEMIRRQKEIMAATAKMGGDLLDLDNHTQLYMEDHNNLSWTGGKKEQFLKYIHKDAKKRVDQKTGAVYITPVGGGKEISMKDFKEMYPTAIPNDIFDGLETTYEAHRQAYFKGTYGKAGEYGLLQNLTTDIKNQINLHLSRDPDANREDIVRAVIGDMDSLHGQKFDDPFLQEDKDGKVTGTPGRVYDASRYRELQTKWEQLQKDGIVDTEIETWMDGSEADLLELRRVDSEFKSLEDEFINWEADKTFSWITGQKAPTSKVPFTAAQINEARRLELLAIKQQNDLEIAKLGSIPKKTEGEKMVNWVMTGMGASKNNSGKPVARVEVGGQIIDGTAANWAELKQNTGADLTELLNHFKDVLPLNAGNFDIVNTRDLTNRVQGVDEDGNKIDLNIIRGDLGNSWNKREFMRKVFVPIPEGGLTEENAVEGGFYENTKTGKRFQYRDGVLTESYNSKDVPTIETGEQPFDNNIMLPGDKVQITRTGGTSEGKSGNSFPVKTEKEIADGENGTKAYYARVLAHITNKDVQTTSGKVETFDHAIITFNGDLEYFINQIAEAYEAEGVQIIQDQATIDAALADHLAKMREIEEAGRDTKQ